MILVLSLLAAPAAAQQPLTYDEALQGALANNGTLARAQSSRDQAAGSLTASQGQFDPMYTLEASARNSRNKGFFQGFPYDSTSRNWAIGNSISGTTGTGTTYAVNLDVDRNISEFTTNFGAGAATQLQDAYTANANVSVTQQLLKGVRFRYNTQNVTRARQALTASELELERQRQEAMYTAAQAYWTWVYQNELHRIALDSVAVAEEALRVGQLQVQSGQLAPVEATRLEAALVQARQSALDAGNAAEVAANQLLLVMGREPSDAVVPATAAGDVPDGEIDPVRAAEVAKAQNLELSVARANLDTAKIEQANAKHGVLPSLAATGAAGVASQRCPPGTDNADCVEGNAISAIGGLAADDNQPFVSIAGTFSVPIGNRGARGERDRTGAVVAQREREVADLERQVAAQVEEQVRTLQSARQRMELADANVRLAEETLKAEEALASAGRSIQKDVLEARTQLDRSKADAAKARTDYRLAQALLLKLQGQLE